MVHCKFIVLTLAVGWIPLILDVVAETGQGNGIDSVITSTHQIQMLYRSEKSFVTQISDLADWLQDVIDSVRIYSNSFDEIRPRQGSQAMHNPIDAHLLIRHLAIGWPMLKLSFNKLGKLIQTAEYFETREQREELPTKTDMESSESALVRLIVAYHLNTSKLVNGILDSETFDQIQSDRKLTVWDLGRIAIGLLNHQYFTPTVELLDESIRVMVDNQELLTAPPVKQQGVKFFVNPSSLIIPAIINENMRSEDLLDIKLTAMKQHDDILEKVIKKEIETCGDGLKTLPYNTRRVINSRSASSAQEAFRNAFKLQLNEIASPRMEREQTMRLCRGQDLRKGVILSKLRCRLSRLTFPPIKLEEISIKPSIIMAHEMMTSSQISQIIRLSASKLQGNGGGPSTSFKSALLDETDVELAFIRRLERITTTKAKPGSQSELSVVRNFGIAGTFGIHSDYRGEYNSHPIHGERLASAQLYLTPVKAGGHTVFPRIGAYVRPRPGSALIYWNIDSEGRPNYLTFNSECPVVHGNKWVLHHWINAKANQQTQKCPLKRSK